MGYAHEAAIKGTMSFGDLEGMRTAAFAIDESNSRFHYLRVNQATGEAEMRYHIEFAAHDGRRYHVRGHEVHAEGRRRRGAGHRGDAAGLHDAVLPRVRTDGGRHAAGDGDGASEVPYVRGSGGGGQPGGFLTSFQITGTDDPVIQFQARMRFIAFTAQFVEREYDPLAFAGYRTAGGGRAGGGGCAGPRRRTISARGRRPNYRTILRDTKTLPLEQLLNTGAVRDRFCEGANFARLFWKGSFAKDTLLGWERSARGSADPGAAAAGGASFAGWEFLEALRQAQRW